MFWDFLNNVPESVHQVTILFSDRGTPDGYRYMDGFSSHTLKMVNDKGEAHYVKLHFKTNQGIRCLTAEESSHLAGVQPDYATADLFNAIERGEYPSWTMKIQIMPEKDCLKYRFNPFDITKVWSHKDYPLVEVGKLVLDRNPKNYFQDVEQSAFSPSHMVPGIEPSADKMLQARLFSYPDTHRHRLGANYKQIPINCPFSVNNYSRDGPMCVNGNGGSGPNYEPNSFVDAPKECPESSDVTPFKVSGIAGHHCPAWRNQDDFVQAGDLFRLMSAEEKQRLVSNIVGHLKNAGVQLQEKQVEIFSKCDSEYGALVKCGLMSARSKL